MHNEIRQILPFSWSAELIVIICKWWSADGGRSRSATGSASTANRQRGKTAKCLPASRARPGVDRGAFHRNGVGIFFFSVPWFWCSVPSPILIPDSNPRLDHYSTTFCHESSLFLLWHFHFYFFYFLRMKDFFPFFKIQFTSYPKYQYLRKMCYTHISICNIIHY